MKLFSLVVALMALLIAPFCFVPYMGWVGIALGLLFALVALIFGLLSRCHFAWVSALIVLICCTLSFPKQLNQSCSIALDVCHTQLLRGEYTKVGSTLKLMQRAGSYLSEANQSEIKRYELVLAQIHSLAATAPRAELAGLQRELCQRLLLAS